jgi:hypothetical protein
MTAERRMKKKKTTRDCKVTITVEIHLDVRENADLDEVLTNVERNTEYALEAAYDGRDGYKLTQSPYVTADLIVKKTGWRVGVEERHDYDGTEAAKKAKKKGKKK